MSFSNFSEEEFRTAFRHFPAGVSVITADIGDGPVGMTVSSLASVSIDPPSVVFSASPFSSSTKTLKKAETIVIHLLSRDHVDVAKICATKNVDKFNSGVEWDRLPTGEPFFTNVASWMRAKVINQININDSTLFILEIIDGENVDNDNIFHHPLVYANQEWHELNGESLLS